MKSLVVSAKNDRFYASGVDGRIMQGDYEKIMSEQMKFSTPYPSKVIALSMDENYLINGSDSAFVQIYDLRLQTRNKPVAIGRLKSSTNDIETLPDNSGFIISSADNGLYHINQLTGVVEHLISLSEQLKCISISPDGKLLAGGTWSGRVILINLVANSYSVILEEPGSRVLSVKFSPNGKLLAYGLDDIVNRRGIVKTYDLQSKDIRQFTGHRAGVYDVEFSPDNKLLASAGLDKRLQMWVLDNPEDLPVEMENNNGFVWDISFTPGSQYLIAACSEAEIRVWPTDPKLLADQICPKLTRNLTQDEWDKYVGDDIDYETTCVKVKLEDY